MSEPITIFHARRILTMNASRPFASHVAVRGGRILGAGELAELEGWGPYRLDESFADRVLMPGLVEGHSHVMDGSVWRFPYVGYYDRRGPDGKVSPGLTSIEAVVERLREAEAALESPGQPLIAWGFDPIFFSGRRMSAADLDLASRARPVAVMHASFHLLNVNSFVLDRAGITSETAVHGVLRGDDGRPSGELREMAAMFLAMRVIGDVFRGAAGEAESVRRFGRLAQLAGVTTVTDLFNELPERTVETYRETTAEADFPVRLVPAYKLAGLTPEEGVRRLEALTGFNTEKLRFGPVKMMTDGSIQGFTARLRWPGYYNGAPNGIWNTSPAELRQALLTFHKAGFQVHIHTNGDEATELALETIESILAEAPRWDHRHTLQHCQMADENQFRRMRSLGLCANLFSNHIFYWGDAHYALTMGPERASRMDAVGTAERLGVPFALHSDAPITPIGPLFSAWCAVNRRTASGRVLGENECIGVAEALRAITLGAAYTLKLDGEIGSIEAGKRADFAVLEEDPLLVSPSALKDVPIWGTVLGGRIFPGPGKA